MNSENEKIRTPEENYEAAFLELAVYRMMKRDRDTVKASMSGEDESELSRAAEESTPRMLNFIDKQMKRVAKRTHLWGQSLRILKTAALVVLILNLGLTIAAAASSNVRAKVIEFLAEINDSYMSMGFSATGEEVIVPEDWPERYYPTYIPRGYSIKQYLPHNGDSLVIYENDEGSTISIEICGTDTFGSLNTTSAEIAYISLHDVTAIVLRQSYGEINIVWTIGDHYFVVSGYNYETVLAVAESLEIVQK